MHQCFVEQLNCSDVRVLAKTENIAALLSETCRQYRTNFLFTLKVSLVQ